MNPVATPPSFSLRGRTALVTGGATGIGYYMARALVRSGARVMIAARREKVLQESASTLSKPAGAEPVRFACVDLADSDDVERFATLAIEELGGIDIFIGNAAQDVVESSDSTTSATASHLLQVNLASNIQMFRSFLPHMRRRKWGRAIFSSSVTSICGADSVSLYSATKAGINGFVRSAAVEAGRGGITVNSLVLGMFQTEMIDQAIALRDRQDGPGAGQAWLNDMSSMTALGRPCALGEIEGVVALLASDAGGAITGSNLVVDGGMSVMLRPITVAA